MWASNRGQELKETSNAAMTNEAHKDSRKVTNRLLRRKNKVFEAQDGSPQQVE